MFFYSYSFNKAVTEFVIMSVKILISVKIKKKPLFCDFRV